MTRFKATAGLLIGASFGLFGVKLAPAMFGVTIDNDNSLNFWLLGLLIAGLAFNFLASRAGEGQADA